MTPSIGYRYYVLHIQLALSGEHEIFQVRTDGSLSVFRLGSGTLAAFCIPTYRALSIASLLRNRSCRSVLFNPAKKVGSMVPAYGKAPSRYLAGENGDQLTNNLELGMSVENPGHDGPSFWSSDGILRNWKEL